MTLAFDPDRPEVLADPYPLYRRLRAEDPVHDSDALGGWVLTRYDDVKLALRDARFSADRATPFAEHMERDARPELARMGRILSQWVVFNDPPRHAVLRRLMVDAFTPRAAESLRARIAEIVDDLIGRLKGRARLDLIADFAYPLPATVIALILGVPDRDLDRFRAWSDDLVAVIASMRTLPDRMARGARALAEVSDYLAGIVGARKRSGARGALVDDLIAAHEADDALSFDELVANCVLILFAGHETTTNLIGNGMRLLLERPDQLARLLADPALMAAAVEEILRFESPAHSVARVAAEDVELAGTTIRRGERVFAMIGAANRDPDLVDDPERFDVTRPPSRHLSFGYGPHFCVGAPLARIEGEIALARLLDAFPALALEPGPPDWEPSLVLRGLKTLPLAVAGTADRQEAKALASQ